MALTQERLKEVLRYDPETGLFYWLECRGRRQIDRPAGTKDASGYNVIGVDGVRYRANRLAWLYMTGEHPDENVDHIDGATWNDRFANLRSCSHSDNQKNMKRHRDNGSGFKGVYTATKGRTWFSQIFSDGKFHYLGSFATKDEAASAYDAAARSLHGEFAKLNEAA
jgi:hypothetical protein